MCAGGGVLFLFVFMYYYLQLKVVIYGKNVILLMKNEESRRPKRPTAPNLEPDGGCQLGNLQQTGGFVGEKTKDLGLGTHWIFFSVS